jgi:hypothetical protein
MGLLLDTVSELLEELSVHVAPLKFTALSSITDSLTYITLKLLKRVQVAFIRTLNYVCLGTEANSPKHYPPPGGARSGFYSNSYMRSVIKFPFACQFVFKIHS